MTTRTHPRNHGSKTGPGQASGREQARQPAELAGVRSPAVPTRLGRYELGDVLTARPMVGDLVTAQAVSDGRALCLRIFGSRVSADPVFRRELKDIARDLRNASTSVVLAPKQIEVIDSHLVTILPFLPGRSLAERARDGALDWDALIPAFAPLAVALDALHALGHRHPEIHPGTVFIDDASSRARLTDVYPATWGAVRPTPLPTALGNLPFLSPEELAGEAVTAGSNVYSLAAVLYWALAGVAPHAGERLSSTLRAHLRDNPPPVRTWWPELPAEAEEALARGLRTDPRGRPRSAGVLVAEVGRALGLRDAHGLELRLEPRHPTTAGRRSPRRGPGGRRGLHAAIATGLVSLTAGWLGIHAGHRDSTPPAPSPPASTVRPSPNYAPVLARLSRDAPPAARRLAEARGTARTAAASRQVAGVYRTAAQGVGSISPPAAVRPLHSQVVADLRALAGTYDDFAAATSRGRRVSAVTAQRAAVRIRQRTTADLKRFVRSTDASRSTSG